MRNISRLKNVESVTYFLRRVRGIEYRPANNEICGIALDAKDAEVRRSYGSVGGGVYIVDENMESADSEVEKLLSKMREEGLGDKVWQHTESEFKRICG